MPGLSGRSKEAGMTERGEQWESSGPWGQNGKGVKLGVESHPVLRKVPGSAARPPPDSLKVESGQNIAGEVILGTLLGV